MLILSLGFISANMLVAGTVYEGNPLNFKSGVSVNVTCDSLTLGTISLNDGAYAVVFDVDSCGSVLVESDYEFTQIATQVEEETITTPTSNTDTGSHSSGGSSIRYYLCGNEICDSGETANTCSADCTIEETTNNSSLNETQENSETTEPQNQRGITGAFIGVGTFVGNYWWIILIVAILVVVFFFVRRMIKNKKN